MIKNPSRLVYFIELLVLQLLTVVCVSAQTAPPKPSVTPIPAQVVTDPTVPTGWRRYQFGEAPHFSVILPEPPEASAERTPGLATGIVNLYLSSNDNAVYAASRIEGMGMKMESASEEVRASFFKNYIEGFSKGFQGSMKTNQIDHELKMLPPTKVRATGRDAHQQDFVVGPLTGRAQLTFAGTSAFCILTVWSLRTPAVDRESFFSSFQLTGTPK